MKLPALWRDTLKKHLLTTTAAIAMIGGAANAQEWDLAWGGFYNADALYNDTSGNGLPSNQDLDGFALNTNAEIIFTPSVTLDNGLTFGINVQLEANTSGDQIDESYVTISSDTMGRVEIGSENSAGYKMMTGAPSAGFGINSPSPSAYHPTGFVTTSGFFRNAFGSTATEVAANNDSMRISYYTPSFNGFTAGVSYSPNQGDDGAGLVNRNGLSDIFDLGLAYNQSFGNVDLSLSARWGTGDAGQTLAFVANPGGLPSTAVFAPTAIQQDDPETWGVGAQIAVAGFTFGGAYAENDAGTVVAGPGGAPFANGVGDSEGWHLGMTYDMGNGWTIGLDGFNGEQSVVNTGVLKLKDEYQAYQIGAERSLGAGVAWRVYAIQSELSTSANAPNFFAPGVSKLKTESTTIGTGITMSF